MQSSQQWIVLARILRPQGRKGEVLAELLTDFPHRFADRPEVWLAPAGYAEGSSLTVYPSAPQRTPRPAIVTSYWLPVGRNIGRVVLHFSGIDSITAAEALASQEVIVPLADRLPLEEDAVYIADLIGCTVYNGDSLLGTVEAVQVPTTPDGGRYLEDAAPLLSVTAPDQEEILIPFARSYLLKVDVAARTIQMNLPDGLADLNRRPAPGR